MLTVRQERREDAVTFPADGEYLWSGSRDGIRVWQVKDSGNNNDRNEICLLSRCVQGREMHRWITAWATRKYLQTSPSTR